MAKAMGLNTVCAYLFWNMHEPQPGEFNWSGQADAAEFCRIAQEEGLWVIPSARSLCVRRVGDGWLAVVAAEERGYPAPHARSAFLDAAKHYLKEVGRVLGPLQITQRRARS